MSEADALAELQALLEANPNLVLPPELQALLSQLNLATVTRPTPSLDQDEKTSLHSFAVSPVGIPSSPHSFPASASGNGLLYLPRNVTVRQEVNAFQSVLTKMMYLVEDDDWEKIYQRVLSHPEEVAVFGKNGGQTGLHAACIKYPPARVISAMVQVSPHTALSRNFMGETPLLLAVSSASEEVQSVLIEAEPRAASVPDNAGDLPLHFAARNGATQALIEKLLHAFPAGMSTTNNRGVTPFWLLPRSYLEASTLEEIHQGDSEDEPYEDDWLLLVSFLKFSYFGASAGSMDPSAMNDYETWIVHAAASSPSCPRAVLRFLCRMFPGAALRTNAQGYTPLFLATQTEEIPDPKSWDEREDGLRRPIAASEGAIRSELESELPAESVELQGGDRRFLRGAVELAEDETNESVVSILLEWSPRSVLVCDPTGRTPLANALIHRRSWNHLKRLISTYPRSVAMVDRPSGLLMFQLAALYSSNVDCIYTLLRTVPYLCSSKPANN